VADEDLEAPVEKDKDIHVQKEKASAKPDAVTTEEEDDRINKKAKTE
jgi:hypothetical protein